MMLLRPPPERALETEGPPAPDVLFKEARRRRRRRWALGAVAVLVAGSGAWTAYGASGNGGPSTRSTVARPPRHSALPTGSSTRTAPPVTASAPPSLQTVAFFDPTLGYGLFRQARGGFCELAVAETTDGGSTFVVPVPVAPCSRFGEVTAAGLAFDDHGDGFVYGTSLFVTHDGGTSWQPDPQPGSVVSVEALGASVWMLEADCAQPPSATRRQSCPLRVYESTDGGRTWAPSTAQPPSASMTGRLGAWWGSLERVSATAAYVVAVPPTATPARSLNSATPGTAPLYFTADGGRSWARRSIPCGANAQRAILSAAPSGTLFAVCGWSSQVGGQQRKAVLVSTDEGATWSRRATCGEVIFTPCPLTSGALGTLDAVSPSTAFEIGNRGPLLQTTDGGTEWSAVQGPGARGGGLATVAFFKPSDGVVLATGHLWHTSDGGQDWSTTTPAVHGAALPALRKGHLPVSSLPAPLDVAARSVRTRTSVPFEAPFVLPPSLSATAAVGHSRYSLSLYECPAVLRFGTPGIGTGTCGGVAREFGSFGGERQASASGASAVLRKAAARPLGCPSGGKLVRQSAPGGVVQVSAAGTGSICAFTWRHDRWAVEVVGAITQAEMTTLVLPPMEQLTHSSPLPGSAGVMVMDRTATAVHVLARWARGSTLYDVSVPTAGTYPTLTRVLALVSDMTPISGS